MRGPSAWHRARTQRRPRPGRRRQAMRDVRARCSGPDGRGPARAAAPPSRAAREQRRGRPFPASRRRGRRRGPPREPRAGAGGPERPGRPPSGRGARPPPEHREPIQPARHIPRGIHPAAPPRSEPAPVHARIEESIGLPYNIQANVKRTTTTTTATATTTEVAERKEKAKENISTGRRYHTARYPLGRRMKKRHSPHFPFSFFKVFFRGWRSFDFGMLGRGSVFVRAFQTAMTTSSTTTTTTTTTTTAK